MKVRRGGSKGEEGKESEGGRVNVRRAESDGEEGRKREGGTGTGEGWEEE